MGTCNFSYNTDVIYSVNNDEDDFIYDDTKQNLISEFSNNKNFEFVELNKYDNNRNFGGVIIGEFYISFNYLNIDFTLCYEIILRGGYYSGFNLDYNFKIDFGCELYDDINDIISDLENYYIEDFITKGLFSIHKTRLINKLEKKQSELKKQIEDIFSIYSDTYIIEGRFSDGTCVYKEI